MGAMITSAADRAIERGLNYLADRQNDDGTFGHGGYRGNVAVCALAAMAFMSAGGMPGRGPFGRRIDRVLDFILDNTQESGFIAAPPFASYGPMYGHGFAAMFLAECYGAAPRADLRDKLTRAIQLIVSTQNHEGGWRYHPRPEDADISVTVCQVMALRSARNAGLYVPSETIDRSIDYVKRSQNPDGGFMYMLAHGGESDFGRSAAGVVALQSAGIYEGEEIDRGLEYLMRFHPQEGRTRRFLDDTRFYYGHYYAVQAFWHTGNEAFARWYPAVRDELIARQRNDGSWMAPISPEYATAMATIVLQVPNHYLPIFQR